MVEQLRGIRCLSTCVARKRNSSGIDVLSCPDAIAKALEASTDGLPSRVSSVGHERTCPDCGGPMLLVERLTATQIRPRAPPPLERLIAHVSLGLVDQVIVHRLDRLSRSLCDSAKLPHDFRQVCVTWSW